MEPLLEITQIATRPLLDDRPVARRIGLIILATDHTTETDFRRLVAGEQLGVYVSRISYANPTTKENLLRMQPALTTAAGLILPDEPLDAVCYACTSATAVIGDRAVADAIGKAKPQTAVVTPISAGICGLRALGVRTISILAPYTPSLSRQLAACFAAQGINVANVACLGLSDDREMARITPASLVELAREATDDRADALFVACTALRAAVAAPSIEAAINRPVVTSNQAMAWQCLRLCGDHRIASMSGRLMSLPLPSVGEPGAGR